MIEDTTWTTRIIGNYAVRARLDGEHCVDVEGRRVTAFEDGTPAYQPDHGPEYSSDPSVATPDFSGYIKWDGCANIDIKRDHFCDPEDVTALGDAIKASYTLAAELMPGIADWV